MAITQNQYTGDGSTVLYSFTFPYLEVTDIKVSLDGVDTTAYTLANATQIQFDAAPANGAAIRLYRLTDDETLAATFFPGSAIRAQDLNDNFTQNLYVVQEASNLVGTVTSAANTALANSTAALATANAAEAKADIAIADSTTAVSTANSASGNASTAVSTANAAAADAAAAEIAAADAQSSAAIAVGNAAAAVSTANAAASDATAAVGTANSAASSASSAVSTANSAVTTANGAVVTANGAETVANAASALASSADSDANAAVSIALGAEIKADAAVAAVGNALLFTIVADVASIPGSPSDGDAIEVADSTGIQSFTPLAGLPGGFVGDPGLSVRIIYNTAGATWNYIQYFPSDPDTRYGDAITALEGDVTTLQGQVGSLPGDIAAIQADVTAVEGDVTTLQGNVSTLQGNVTTLQGDVTAAEGSITTLQGRVTTAESDITILEGDVSILSSTKLNISGGVLTGGLGATLGSAAAPAVYFDGDAGLYSPGADQVAISTNGAERIRVGASGQIGLGGANYGTSGQYLTSNGAGAAPTWTSLTINPDKILEGDSSAEVIDTGADGRFVVTTDNAERLRVDSSNVLIGHNASLTTCKVQIEGPGDALSLRKYGNDTSSVSLTLTKTRGTTPGSFGAVNNLDPLGGIYFRAADGTADRTAAAIIGYCEGTPAPGDLPGRLLFFTTPTGSNATVERLRITKSGTFTILNSTFFHPATDNAVQLGWSSGRFSSVWAANGTVQTSDKRAKADITPSSLGTDFIKALRPVSYRWIEGGKRDTGKLDADNNIIFESVPGNRTHWGFIAQEVKDLADKYGVDFGGWVLSDKDDPDSQQALRYDQFISPLTKALQESIARIERLEAEVRSLKP